MPNSARVGDLTERELVARIQARLPPPPPWLTIGIGDDAAVVEPERNRVEVLTVDALIEGIHFDRRFTPPEAIGHRALASNLSDLAAMGAAPRLVLLSFALPPSLACRDFEGIVCGLTALAARFRVHIAGGNLTRSPGPIMLDVVVAGTLKRRQALTRGGAKPGDDLYVTGTIGAAAAGLQILKDSTADTSSLPSSSSFSSGATSSCVARYLYPEPRVRVGVLLARNRAATACIDLSDGLADGLRQLADASGVGVLVDEERLPIDAGSRACFDPEGDGARRALSVGDDYELLFAVRPRLRGRLRTVARHGGVALTRIGVCTPDRALVLRRPADGGTVDEPLPHGYTHFR